MDAWMDGMDVTGDEGLGKKSEGFPDEQVI